MKNYKYAVILCDGMADYADKNGDTPLTKANKPNIDSIAKNSECGLCHTIPPGMSPGSDTANLSVMGYDPKIFYTGRSPLEAISIGVDLNDDDITYRMNFVTLSNEDNFADKTMLDYSAGEISTEKAKELIRLVSPLIPKGCELYAGVSYRHCLVRRNGKTGAILKPPHDITNKKIAEFLPSGEFSEELLEFMKNANSLLSLQSGTKANAVWLWGEGKKPALESFEEKFKKRGAVISAVDLIKGIGIGAKMKSIDVEGATGTLHTNFDGKAQAAINALKEYDYLYLHIEAPDECGHQGDRAGKIKSIELIDEKIVKPIFEHLKSCKEPYKMLITCDHATPLILRTHTSDPVPFLIFDSQKQAEGVETFNEFTAKSTGNVLTHGTDLSKKLFS